MVKEQSGSQSRLSFFLQPQPPARTRSRLETIAIIFALLVLMAAAPPAEAVSPQLDAGALHSVALRSDGTVWTWGNNSAGQLGNRSTESSATPVAVWGLSGIVAVSAGSGHTMALKGDGTVWTWGMNSSGQLGDGTQLTSASPVQVAGLYGVTAIGAGQFHSLAVKADGTLWAWGAKPVPLTCSGSHCWCRGFLLSPPSRRRDCTTWR